MAFLWLLHNQQCCTCAFNVSAGFFTNEWRKHCEVNHQWGPSVAVGCCKDATLDCGSEKKTWPQSKAPNSLVELHLGHISRHLGGEKEKTLSTPEPEFNFYLGKSTKIFGKLFACGKPVRDHDFIAKLAISASLTIQAAKTHLLRLCTNKAVLHWIPLVVTVILTWLSG